MEIDETNIVLRCVADNKSELLEKAVLNGWKQCKTCKYPICNICLKIFLGENEDNPLCPGTYLKYNHTIVVENIPTEIILIEAKKSSMLPKTGILINKAFYLVQDDALDGRSKIIEKKFEESSVSFARQEQWLNMGSVIVKRNRGKYVSWERL